MLIPPMEAHPVPQNVTSFEFRLIGDMTLKQFAYLAIGAGTAYLFFVFLAIPAPFLAWPVIIVSSFLGVAFAFIPIADRPLDHWTKAFLKAVYSPTKRTWQKQGKAFNLNPLFNQRLNLFLSSQGVMPAPINLSQMSAARAPIPYSQPAPSPAPKPPLPPQPHLPPVQPPAESNLPSADELAQTVNLAKEAQSLQVKILESQRELERAKFGADAGQFNEVFKNLQKLMTEAQETKKELATVTKEPATPAPVKIQVVSPLPQKQTQMTLTSFPNVINGIMVDSQGNYLEGVVVVIHDKDGLPVRALKSNKLGQFTGATPLPNGTYTIELEKDNLMFDILQIQLEGKLLPPIKIAAKRITPSGMTGR